MARGADVVHGTRADATRHARPRVRAAHGPRGEPEWPELTPMRDSDHARPRIRLRGHHVASGEAGIWRAHELVGAGEIIWGGNANAYRPSTFYTCQALPFSPCGTKSP